MTGFSHGYCSATLSLELRCRFAVVPGVGGHFLEIDKLAECRLVEHHDELVGGRARSGLADPPRVLAVAEHLGLRRKVAVKMRIGVG